LNGFRLQAEVPRLKINESTIRKTELMMAVIVIVVLVIGYVVSRM